MKIPISKIRFNPENPRHFINPDSIDSLAASFKANGQLESVKVRKLTSQDTPSQGCTGTEPAEYELFEGERRLRAAMKLGWTEIEAEVFTGSREDYSLKGFMNNNGEPYHWLDKYRYIADYVAKHPDLTQKEIGDKLEVDQQGISEATQVIPLLNKGAMEIIYLPEVKSKGWKVPEKAVLALIYGLGSDLRRPELVERCVKVLIEQKMTVEKTKKLAEWVKAGNMPESYPAGGKAGERGKGQEQNQTDGPYAKLLQELGQTGYFKIKRQAKGGLHIIIPDETNGALAALGAAGALWARENALRAGEKGEGVGGKVEQQQNQAVFFEGNPYLADLPGMIKQVQGSKAGSGVSDSTGVPSMKGLGGKSFSDNTGVLSLLKNAAAAGTPKHISGKILKKAVVFAYNLYINHGKAQQNNKQGPAGMPTKIKSMVIGGFKKISFNNKAVIMGMSLIALIAAGAFILQPGLKLILPAAHTSNAHSMTAQKPALMPAVTQISTVSYAQAPVSGETSSFVKTTADKSANKPVYKPTVKPKDKTVNKKLHIKGVYAAASPSIPYDMSDEWKQAMQDFNQKNYEGALLWLGKTEDIYGDKPYICKYMADCEYIQSDFNEAEEHYKEYLGMNPGDKDAEEKLKKCESELALPPAPDGMEAGK